MSFCVKIETAIRNMFFGVPDEEPEICFFMGDGKDPHEAIYRVTSWNSKTRKRKDGRLPWAVMDAWNACEGAMDGLLGRDEYTTRSYYTRQAWVAKAEEILRSRRSELDAILAKPDAFYEPVETGPTA